MVPKISHQLQQTMQTLHNITILGVAVATRMLQKKVMTTFFLRHNEPGWWCGCAVEAGCFCMLLSDFCCCTSFSLSLFSLSLYSLYLSFANKNNTNNTFSIVLFLNSLFDVQRMVGPPDRVIAVMVRSNASFWSDLIVQAERKPSQCRRHHCSLTVRKGEVPLFAPRQPSFDRACCAMPILVYARCPFWYMRDAHFGICALARAREMAHAGCERGNGERGNCSSLRTAEG